MRRIFELTKREQRIIILIVIALAVVAFAKHWFEIKSSPARRASSAEPTAAKSTPSPTVYPREENETDDSR
jgi:hypothetical protein